jgi:hypothetical protein
MAKRPGHRDMIYGKPVVNGKRKVLLHISPADIKSGKSRIPGACAAAQALMRTIPNCVKARVHLGRTYIMKDDEQWYRYKTPEALRTEIVALDRGGRFEPGDYELRPMSPSDLLPHKKREKVSRSETNRRGPPNSPSKHPRKLHVTKGVRPSQRAGMDA